MGIIRQLTPAVINQIAAGEVVERPASVVKELLENAIDAQATRIDLSVERGGKDLVRVADNGVGMTPDDLILAFQPHATSKLADADDLFRIRTLGLPRRGAGGDLRGRQGPLPDASSRGRRRFRAADRRGRLRPGQEMRLSPGHRDGSPKPVLQHPGAPDVSQVGHDRERSCRRHVFADRAGAPGSSPDLSLGEQGRLRPAAGPGYPRADRDVFWPRAGRVVALGGRAARFDMQLWGYVAHPSQSRSSAKGQFLFIGGRYVRDRSLSHALNEAYRGLLMVGRMPVAFLHLEIPADEVDVNVHPTKIEVRFRDSQRVYSHLLSTLRQTFLKSDLHSRLQATPEPAARRSQPESPSVPARWLSRTGVSAPEPASAWRQRRAARAGRRPDRPPDRRVLVRAEPEPGRAPRIDRPAALPFLGSIAAAGVSGRAGRGVRRILLRRGAGHGFIRRQIAWPRSASTANGPSAADRSGSTARAPAAPAGDYSSTDRSRGTGGVPRWSPARSVVIAAGRTLAQGHSGP